MQAGRVAVHGDEIAAAVLDVHRLSVDSLMDPLRDDPRFTIMARKFALMC